MSSQIELSVEIELGIEKEISRYLGISTYYIKYYSKDYDIVIDVGFLHSREKKVLYCPFKWNDKNILIT